MLPERILPSALERLPDGRIIPADPARTRPSLRQPLAPPEPAWRWKSGKPGRILRPGSLIRRVAFLQSRRPARPAASFRSKRPARGARDGNAPAASPSFRVRLPERPAAGADGGCRPVGPVCRRRRSNLPADLSSDLAGPDSQTKNGPTCRPVRIALLLRDRCRAHRRPAAGPALRVDQKSSRTALRVVIASEGTPAEVVDTALTMSRNLTSSTDFAFDT